MQLKIVTALILVVPLFSAHAETKKVKLHNNVEAMKQEVLKRIPIGSSMEYTQEVMKKSGFKCQLMWNESFASDGAGKIPRKGDLLYCDKEKSAFLVFDRRWQIAIVHKNGVVSEMFVSIGLTGL